MAKIPRFFPWLIFCSMLLLALAGCTTLASNTPPPNLLVIRVSPPATLITPLKTFTITNPPPEPSKKPSNTPMPPTPTLRAPTPTPLPPTPTPALPVVHGNLKDIIAQLEAGVFRQGSEGFQQPDDTVLADFARLGDQLLSGNFSIAAEISMQYGYELVNYRDQTTRDSEYLLLREIRTNQHGWGLFIINLEACRDPSSVLIVEAPHILSDEGTPQIALDMFRALHGCALMVAGAHRGANWDGSADVAHNPKTVFQTIQTAIANAAGPATLVLQIHGFAADKHPGYPSIVLGGRSATDQSVLGLLTALKQSLEEHGISAGVCDDVSWKDLCGETNVLANTLPAGLFIHLEMDETARSGSVSVISSLAEVIYGEKK